MPRIPERHFPDYKTAADRKRPRKPEHDSSWVWAVAIMAVTAIIFYAL